MSPIVLDLSGVAWVQVARALKSVADHVERRAMSARIFVDHHFIHETRKLARYMDLDDYIDVEGNRRAKARPDSVNKGIVALNAPRCAGAC